VERSGNMKKDLKQTIFETVGSLRNLFEQLQASRDSKSQTITDLEGRVSTMKAKLDACRVDTGKVHREPSVSTTQ